MAKIRQQAVQRVLNGESPSAVMQALGFNRSSIYRWLRQYRTEGEGGLQAKAIQGRPPKLDIHLRRKLRLLISNQSPRQFGFEKCLWTSELLLRLIKKEYAMAPGKTAFNYLLADFGLSNQRMQNRLPTAQQHVKALTQAKKENAAVYCLTLTRSPSQVNSISAATPGGKLYFMIYNKRITAAQLCEFLATLLRVCGKKLYLLFDDNPDTQAMFQKETVQRFLNKHIHHLSLHNHHSNPSDANSPQKENRAPPAPPPLSDLEAWGLLIHQSLLDFQFPLGDFLMALNRYFGGSAIIAPNLRVPSSPLRPVFADADMEKMIWFNESMLQTWHDNPLIDALEKPGDLLLMDDLISRDQWRDNAYCRDQLARAGGHHPHILGLCFAGLEDTLCALFIFRSKPFSVMQKQFLKRLRPHLETAIKLTTTYLRNIYTLTALEEATDHLDISTLVLDGSRQVIKCNGAAQELLAQKRYVKEINKALHFRDTSSQTKFEKAVDKAIRWRQIPLGNKPVEAFQFSLATEKPGGNTSIGVLVQPITPPSFTIPHSTVVSPHVVVYISNPDRPKEISQLQLIAQLFSLSRREARLTTLIAEGVPLHEAAAKMNITQATARTYLQHIYEKTGVRRRQDLVQRVLKSVALLA